MKLNKFLIILFSLFIAVDILLVGFYFKNKLSSVPKMVDNKYKDFVVKSNNFSFSSNSKEIKNIEPTDSIFVLKEVSLYGYIDKPAFLDIKTNKIILPLIIRRENNNIYANLVLGAKDQRINTVFAEKGLLKDPLSYTFETAENLMPKYKKGDPIIISLFYDEVPSSLEKKEGCNTACMNFLKPYKETYSNTTSAIDLINKNKKSDRVLVFGPPLTTIVYDKY